MARLRVPPGAIADGEVVIDGAERRHLRVLRLGAGDELVVFDGSGAEHDVRLTHVDRRSARGRIVRTTRPERESPLHLTLVPAVLKGPRMDVLVEKTAELGIVRLAPVLTRRVVVRGDRRERWERIAAAAAKQSGRTHLPRVDAPVPLAVRLAEPRAGLGLFAWEDEPERRLTDLPPRADAVTLVTGPEGGFDDRDVACLRAEALEAIGLGRRILRAETAAIVATALCQHRWGDG